MTNSPSSLPIQKHQWTLLVTVNLNGRLGRCWGGRYFLKDGWPTHRHTIKIQQKRRWGGCGTNGIDFNRPKGRSWDPPLEWNIEISPQKACGPHSQVALKPVIGRGQFPERLLAPVGLRLRKKTLISLPCSRFLRFCEFLSPSRWQEFTPHQTSWWCR